MLNEIYVGQDKSLYKIKRLPINPAFFRYSELSRDEIKKLRGLLYERKGKGTASSTGNELTAVEGYAQILI